MERNLNSLSVLVEDTVYSARDKIMKELKDTEVAYRVSGSRDPYYAGRVGGLNYAVSVIMGIDENKSSKEE